MESFSIFKLYFADFNNDNESFLNGKETMDAIKFMETFLLKNSKAWHMFSRIYFWDVNLSISMML